MKSEDEWCSFQKPRAPVCSQFFEAIQNETCMKVGEPSSSARNSNDQRNKDFPEITVKREPDDEDFLSKTTGQVPHRTGGETSSSICLVDQQDGELQKSPIKEEAPAQELLYCEECGSFFISKCEVHGPARFIHDTPVPMGIAGRATRTVPPGLEVRGSGIPNAGLGVFNVGETVPVGVHFGPYEGDVVDKDEAMNSGYSWVIYRDRQCEEYIDAKREMSANWMRYVNCARNDEEQNLVAFQYRGGIFYRCCRPVKPGQELLVWYDEEYAKDLGSAFDSLWNKKCSANAPGSNAALFQMFSCSFCPLSYSSQIHLHKHMKRSHADAYQILQKSPTCSSDRQQTSSGTFLISHKQTKKGIHHCSDCGRTFTDLRNLKTHQRVHTGEKPYQCSQCGKSFARQDTLEIHQRVHTGEKPYPCSQCGRSFTFPSSFRRHQRIHSGEKPYYCSQCGKRFTDPSSLRRHQRVHSGEKPYHCSQCGKRFNRRNHLETHQHIHSGEKPYNCSQCGRSFNYASSLRTHHRIHTGQKPYHCIQCGKSFTRQDTLEMHQRIHTGEKPYHCSQCGKSFTQESTLRNHQLIHKGQKPYHCMQCGKSFTQKGNLKTHQRVHTGEMYNCSQCGKSFALLISLQQHQCIYTG